MTRENKLALIIGFGLLLFVGILVSDHLSARTGPAVVPIALRTKEQVSLPRELEVPREFGQASVAGCESLRLHLMVHLHRSQRLLYRALLVHA